MDRGDGELGDNNRPIGDNHAFSRMAAAILQAVVQRNVNSTES
jgi:hypothetical protein